MLEVRSTTAWSSFPPRGQGIVPLDMEWMRRQSESGYFLVGNFDAAIAGVVVERRLDDKQPVIKVILPIAGCYAKKEEPRASALTLAHRVVVLSGPR